MQGEMEFLVEGGDASADLIRGQRSIISLFHANSHRISTPQNAEQ
jgi:hypothetical protein